MVGACRLPRRVDRWSSRRVRAAVAVVFPRATVPGPEALAPTAWRVPIKVILGNTDVACPWDAFCASRVGCQPSQRTPDTTRESTYLDQGSFVI